MTAVATRDRAVMAGIAPKPALADGIEASVAIAVNGAIGGNAAIAASAAAASAASATDARTLGARDRRTPWTAIAATVAIVAIVAIVSRMSHPRLLPWNRASRAAPVACRKRLGGMLELRLRTARSATLEVSGRNAAASKGPAESEASGAAVADGAAGVAAVAAHASLLAARRVMHQATAPPRTGT